MKKIYLIITLLLSVHLLILFKLQFTAWPEMVAFPYLINHGFVTYKDMVHAYPPLLIDILTVLFRVFGYQVVVLKIFGWVTILLSDILIFLIVKKHTKKVNLAFLGVSFYIILQPVLDGNMVWPDLFIIPFLLLSYLFLLNKKYLWSGVAIGLAILTKQTGIFFLGIAAIWLLAFVKKPKSIILFFSAILFTGLPFLFILFKQNAFSEFVNWVIIYPSKYWTKFPGYVQLTPTLRENLLLLALFGPFSFLIFRAKKKIFADKYFLLLFGFLMAGVVGVYPRFSFFHFQSALAFLVIAYFYLFRDLKLKNIYVLFLIPIFILVINFRSLQFGNNRFWTNRDLKLGRIIRNETVSGKPIYLLGLPAQFYVFSDRLPNKPWLDNFGWYLEIPGVQASILEDLKKDPPQKVFWETPEAGNWYDTGVYQPEAITNWIINNYNKEKLIQSGLWEWTKR